MKDSIPMETLKVALYVRVSTEEQIERYGIPLQIESLKALIKSRPKLEDGRDSMTLAGEQHIYMDKGFSGTLPLNERPAFLKLKEDILHAPAGQRPFDVIAVYKIDRFARSLKILLEAIDFFEQNEIKLLSANESIDTSTPFGRAMLSIIGVIAELERDTIVDRTQAGREQAFEAGVAMGSNVPYGYVKDEYKKYKIFEYEANIVREIFRLFVEGRNTADEIAKSLTSNDVPSPQASAILNNKRKGIIKKKNPIVFWRAERVRYILKDEIYIGKIYSNKKRGGKDLPKSEWKLSPATAPAIIDIVTFTKAQKLLADTSYHLKEAKDKHIYLLRGLLKCECCYDPQHDLGRINWIGDRKEIRKGSKKFTYSYKCGRKNARKHTRICSTLPLPAEAIEQYVTNFTRKLLKDPKGVFEYQKKLKSKTSLLEHLEKKERSISNIINDLVFQRENLREQHKHGHISIAYLNKSLKDLGVREMSFRELLKVTRGEIAQSSLTQEYLKALNLFSDKYKAGLEDLYANRQELYTLLHELIEEIVVYSRPVKKTDIIAGKKKEVQQIPNKLHIKLKLPQDLLQELIAISSGSNSASGAR